MTYGQQVAKQYKAQYYTKQGGWDTFEDWELQPMHIHTILLELKSLNAIRCLVDKSWTQGLAPKSSTRKKVMG